MKRIFLITLMLSALITSSCNKVNELEQELLNTAAIVLAENQKTELTISPRGETIDIKFNSTLAWKAEVNSSASYKNMIEFIPNKGDGGDVVCKVKILKNESGKTRTFTLIITSEDIKVEFNLTQKSLDKHSDKDQDDEDEDEDGEGEGEDPDATNVASILAKGVGTPMPENTYIDVYVISDMNLGNLTSKKNMYVQDATGGLMVRFISDHTFNRGDRLKIDVSQMALEEYQSTIQFNNVDADSKVEFISGNNDIPCRTVSMSDFLANKYSGQYVALNNIQVTDADLSKTFVVNGSHTSINMEDADGNTFVVFSSSYASFGSETVPQGAGTLKGIAAINNSKIQIIFSQQSDWTGLTGPRHGEESGGSEDDDTDTPGEEAEPGQSGKYSWYELPKFTYTTSNGYMRDTKDSDLYYAHHICAGGEKGPGGKTARNYTVCYSAEHHCPVWVAAPRHKMYESGASRTNAYGKDPSIPSDIQYNSTSTGGGCNKGHMLGSAERLSSSATNKQVFYYTNIAPQYSSTFNTGGGGWNILEDWVDEQVCSDTLYVVIGTYFDNYTDKRKNSASPKTISFGGRNDVSCPTMFYYILMRTKSGSSGKSLSKCSSSEIKCAAFVRSHNTAKGTKVSSDDLMSVSDLEKITGFTYFPNVPHAPKNTVKASDWGL